MDFTEIITNHITSHCLKISMPSGLKEQIVRIPLLLQGYSNCPCYAKSWQYEDFKQ
jgi:hypothetical protein